MLAVMTPDAPTATSLLGAGTLIALVLGYLVGFAHAVWRRARADYVRAKDSIPGLRSNKWSEWSSLVKRGAVALGVVLVLMWLYRHG